MNGLYLYVLLREIKGSIVNHLINRVTIKDRLVQVELDNNSLFISLHPLAPCIFISSRMANFRRLDLFDDNLSGCHINEVIQPDFMPTLKIAAEKVVYGQRSEVHLGVSLYREAPNLAIKTAGLRKNLYPRFVEKKSRKTFLGLTGNDLTDKEELVKNFDGIDKFLARELNLENLSTLQNIITGTAASPKLVSIAPLRISYFAQTFIAEYASLNDLLRDAMQRFMEQNEIVALESEKKARAKKIERQIERLGKNLQDNRAIEQLRINGELILASMAKIKKGMTSITVGNPYTQEQVEIKLDPTKSPPDNAQQYFKKYKKMKRGIPQVIQRIAMLKKEIEKIKSLLIPDKDRPAAESKTARTVKPVPFRTFTLSSGSLVYIGKSSKSNELLTFKFARPNDYFFHARGIEGAHVILKPKLPKDQNPKKEDLEAAASIAAFYTKAKKQKKVPVSYTQRKYLKKNKKGKIGSVILMREEVIFVDPADPALLGTRADDTRTHD